MMNQRWLFVDFENIQKINLAKLSDDFSVTIFVGTAQKNIPFELVQGAQKLGARLEWIRVDGAGKNALDFHIAYSIGCLSIKSPTATCYVLSKDSGFDPLMRHLVKNGFDCRRINSLIELNPKPKEAAVDANFQRVMELLKKSEKKSRPRRRETLAQHISAMFQKKLPENEVGRLVDLMFIEGKVTENNLVLSYTF